ncbi:subclass B1 metallo-beta-lactamase [Dyadobacter pollutisoli]|uniref:beta-lactamase n=1 Tax=Dyadobacter pollutisoli TaxID=2910158 RepID=A0A9E8SLQ6_9BACT|nr:subclass B1 metallo-beta-lactamase [Dyadobacter pollutisoli]WAC13353.1 subclass B1 metallo-beta-lactamase [Dyadobacter pollutisoli]
MKFVKFLLFILFIVGFECSAQTRDIFKSKNVYQSKNLLITQIDKNSYEHISYSQTNDFGKVPCNGLIVRNDNEVIVFDTPIDDKSSEELIRWIKEKLHCKINAIIPTHFHNDCLGGLKAFHDNSVASYAYFKTIKLAAENNYVVPQNSFQDSLNITVGHENVIVKFFGDGHTKDNVVGYFPKDNIMFGGCLIKELDAEKGYLGDANIAEWSPTVEKVKKWYPNVKIVVPGHGDLGNSKLLDYTIKLFSTN